MCASEGEVARDALSEFWLAGETASGKRISPMSEVAGQPAAPGEQCVPARRQLAGRYSLPDEAPS
eukprot:80353-Pyramimonas_sp.AAC.1